LKYYIIFGSMLFYLKGKEVEYNEFTKKTKNKKLQNKKSNKNLQK